MQFRLNPTGQSANWMDGKSSTEMKISDVKSEILAPPDHGVQVAPHLYLTTQLKICTKHIHPQPLFGPSTNIYHIQHTDLILFSHPHP